ncbi:MAG: hypothetical protein ACRDAW_01370 [Metamycoplasmataceae bacterium]
MKKRIRTLISVSPLVVTPIVFLSFSLPKIVKNETIINHELNFVSPKFVAETLQISCSPEDAQTIASNILEYQLEDYSRDLYQNDKEAPGYGKNNIRIKIVLVDNLEGTITYKAFPEKYLENGVLTNNDLNNPTYFQSFQLIGLKKVIPTQFKRNVNINVLNLNPSLNNQLPSRVRISQIRTEIAKNINLFLEGNNESLNVPTNLSANNIIIDPTSIMDDDLTGEKKLTFQLNKYFDISGNEVDGLSSIQSQIITFNNFGKDLLGNGQVVTDKTNTIFKINPETDVFAKETFSTQLASSFVNNEPELKRIIELYSGFQIASAFNFDSFTFVTKMADNFLGTIDLLLQIPRYIENGKVIDRPINITTHISGFGQALLSPDQVTGKDITTSIVAKGNYDLNLNNVIASNSTVEQIKEGLSKKQIVVNSLKANDFDLILEDRDDNQGSVNVLVVVKQYIKDGRYVDAKNNEALWLKSPITIIGFALLDSYNLDQIYLWSFISTTIALVIISAGIITYLMIRNKKKLVQYGIIENKSKKIPTRNIEQKNPNEAKLLTHTTTYEEYYVPSIDDKLMKNERKFDIDEIISNTTIDFNSNQEDTIDRMLNEIDDEDL